MLVGRAGKLLARSKYLVIGTAAERLDTGKEKVVEKCKKNSTENIINGNKDGKRYITFDLQTCFFGKE